MVNIKYSPVSVMSAEIDIDNIGECCLKAEDELGSLYYLIISTDSGVAKTIKFGPIQGESGYEPNKSKVEYESIVFDAKKLIAKATYFLTGNKIVNAEVIDKSEAVDELVNAMRRLCE